MAWYSKKLCAPDLGSGYTVQSWDANIPLRTPQHAAFRYVVLLTCLRSCPLTFCLSCACTWGWIFRLRVRHGGNKTPFHGCWWSGSLPTVPPLTTAVVPPNETSRLWFPLEKCRFAFEKPSDCKKCSIRPPWKLLFTPFYSMAKPPNSK